MSTHKRIVVHKMIPTVGRSQWPRVLMCGSEVTRLLGIAGSNPAGSMGSVSWEVCVLSGRGLCDGSIPRPEASTKRLCHLV